MIGRINLKPNKSTKNVANGTVINCTSSGEKILANSFIEFVDETKSKAKLSESKIDGISQTDLTSASGKVIILNNS